MESSNEDRINQLKDQLMNPSLTAGEIQRIEQKLAVLRDNG